VNTSKKWEKIVNLVCFLKYWQGIGSYGLRMNDGVLEILSLLARKGDYSVNPRKIPALKNSGFSCFPGLLVI
jgi:hypothetical protein